ncbi:hypothetical protein [Falsiroseomonas sp.]|uniref:hypothetical protein n=1 Tax=Falsiroseomonas sp. TaxID=2870721 RepID=UPI003569C868
MRLLPVLALSAALLTGACTNPDGTLNVPGTVALGAGAAIAGLAIASANDRPRRSHYRHRDYGYGRPAYGYGYGRPAYGYGYGRPHYRRW